VLIQFSEPPPVTSLDGPVSPLNAVWHGELRRHAGLPQLGHLLLIFPLGERAFSCAGVTVEPSQYILLTPRPNHHAVVLDLLESQAEASPVLVLWLSPPFLADLARFLDIPEDLQQLLHSQPLLQGDPISSAAAELAAACRSGLAPEITEDLFLEVAGEVLRLMRLRHQALQKMSRHKDGTVADLLPRLLLARQFVEARYAEDFRSQEVADRAGLSEFHFARLFRTAFDISLRQQVIHLRLDAARRLLEIPGNTVTETTFQVGYGSLSSFIHAFSKRFGLSPAQYRARVEKSRI